MQNQEHLRTSTRKASPFILRLKTLRLESAKSNSKVARSTIIRHGAPIPVSSQKEPHIKPTTKPSKPRSSQSGFDLDEISSFCVEDDGTPRSPFKLLRFEDEISPAKTAIAHRRQPSMIVKNIKQSYSFGKVYDVNKAPSDGDLTPTLTPHKQTPIPFFQEQDSEELSELSFTDQESPAKDRVKNKDRDYFSTTPKDSFFASTVEPKSSIYNNSEIRSSLFGSESSSTKKDERKSTIYTLSSSSSSKFMYTYSSDRTDTANLSPPLTDRAHGNTTTQGINTQERDSVEAAFFAGASSKFDFERSLKAPRVKGKKEEKLAYGLIPMKAFCSKCGSEVMTVVDMKLPRAPL
jgi:hypothetical protein